MKLPVNDSHINRFDKLYHILLQCNLMSEPQIPEEMKGLTTLDISVVNVVAYNSDIIIREIAEKLKIPNSTLTSSLNRLEKKELAFRVISSRDRRSFGLRLTEKGIKLQKAHLEFEKRYFEDILSKLDTNEDRDTLLDLFEKIVKAYEKEKRG